MFKLLNMLLTGNPYALNKNFITKIKQRHRFAPLLPYRYFDEEHGIYLNVDGTMGKLWECSPLIFAGNGHIDLLANLVNQPFDNQTMLQFVLYADPNIEWILNRHLELQTQKSELGDKSAQKTVAFFKQGTQGIEKLQGIPIRNFRLWVSIKSAPGAKYELFKDYCNTTYEALKGVELCPWEMKPVDLVNSLAKLFNNNMPDFEYDPRTVINEQILTSESNLKIKEDQLKIGKKHWACLSVKKFPQYIDPFTMNYLSGDWQGVTGDSNQVLTPFLITTNIIFDDVSKQLHTKCNIMLNQKFVGSFGTKLKLKQDEFMWATGELEKQTSFVRVMPMIWHWADDKEMLEKNGARIERLWGAKGFVMQKEKAILLPMLLSALPLGLYNDKKNIDFLNRDFLAHPKAAAQALPVQADVKGGINPVVPLVGRKGQIINLDLFDPTAGNYNAIVCAKSGKGKSFLLNYILEPYLRMGVIIRVIDLGGSFKKLSSMFGGKFLQFTKNSDICLNPFTFINDIEDSLQSLATILSQMIYSATKAAPTEVQFNLLKMAIRYVWDQYGTAGGIDPIFEVLKQPRSHLEQLEQFACEDDKSCMDDVLRDSTMMAFNLMKFTSAGEYGRLFNGRSNLNFYDEQLVVLELDELKGMPELFRVVTLQLIDMMTHEIYIHKKRGVKEIALFEEAWQYLDSKGIGSEEVNILGDIIAEGYRRARKYGGSFITVLQSILDYSVFGKNAQAILSNADFRFLLESSDFDMAAEQKLINYGSFGLQLLNSIKSSKPKYSEIFIDTPTGKGAARCVVDNFKYFMSTTDADDVAKLDYLVQQVGMSWPEAMEYLADHDGRIELEGVG